MGIIVSVSPNYLETCKWAQLIISITIEFTLKSGGVVIVYIVFFVVPASSVRDLTPISLDGRPTWISLNWQPPRQTNGQITGKKIGPAGNLWVGC